jgi:hypothetical protein
MILAAIVLTVGAILSAPALPALPGEPVPSGGLLADYNRATKPAGYRPEDNAAPLYRKAMELYVDRPETIPARASPWDQDSTELKTLRKWLESNSACLESFKLASQKPYCWFERQNESGKLRDIDFNPELSAFKQLGELLESQAKLKAFDHDPQTAYELILDLRRTGCHLMGNHETWIHQMVGLGVGNLSYRSAFNIIQNMNVAADTLTSFQQKLTHAVKTSPQYIAYTAGELLFNRESIHEAFTDDGNGNGKVIPSQLKEQLGETVFGHDSVSYPEAYWIALWHPDKRQTLQTLDQIAAYVNSACRETPWQLRQKGTDMSEEILKLAGRNRCLQRLDTVGMLHRIQHQQTACASALITTVAILRYRADKREFPPALDELTRAGYLDIMPQDPYSSGPLIYRTTEGGFTLYSIGADFKDDGGKHVGWSSEDGDFVFWPVPKTEEQ